MAALPPVVDAPPSVVAQPVEPGSALLVEARALEMAHHQRNAPKRHYAQFGQDALIGDIIFRSRPGFFVDVGARDGRVISNTYYLEQELGWTGIAIEPHPDLFAELEQIRSCRCVNVAAGRKRAKLEFVKLLEPPMGNSGLLSTFRDRDRLQEMKHEIIAVPVRPLSQILKDIPLVHYLDIDVEGHELAVLQGIDFSAVEIRIIGVEVGEKRAAIDALLAHNGYRPFLNLGADRFYSYGDVPSASHLLKLA